jgi:ankyrin repeat protein
MLAGACAPEALSFVLALSPPPSAAQTNAALLLASGVRGCSQSAAVVTSLLAAGASANAIDDDGYSALMRSAGAGDREVFHILIQAGADPSITSADGANAFVIALVERNQAALQLLRPHITAAMANPRSVTGQPALVAVAMQSDLDSLLELISHGALVSDVGEDGVTVAHALLAVGAADTLEKVLEFIKNGAGGKCAINDGFSETGSVSMLRSCASEIMSIVTGSEKLHGGV